MTRDEAERIAERMVTTHHETRDVGWPDGVEIHRVTVIRIGGLEYEEHRRDDTERIERRRDRLKSAIVRTLTEETT